MGSLISNLDRQLENLVEISIKLADKQEVGTTKRGFTAVYKILERFFEARKDSSLIVPSSIAFLAVESDSQNFLVHNFERLNKAGEKFIKDGKDEIATYIIDVYRALAIKAKDINFIGRKNENPIIDLLVGYLNFFIDTGQRAKNIEVVYQGSRVLGEIAVISADKGLDLTLRGAQKKLLNIAIFSLSQKQSVIVDNCNMTFLRIISAVFDSDKIVRKYHFDDALKNIATISNYISVSIKSGLLPDDISTSFTLSKGYDEFYMVLNKIMDRYSKITDTKEKDRYRSDLIEFFREINKSLRTLSEQIKSSDTVLTDSIGRLLFNINSLIIKLIEEEEGKNEKDELRNVLDWNVHLPYWFTHYAETFDAGSNPFNTLTDSVAKTGIIAAERLNDKKIVLDCVKSLYSITKQSLEKTTSSYGYDEPRVLEKACYLGVLALKKGWDDIVIEVGLIIYDFEPKYFTKYLTNLPKNIDPLNHEVIGLPHDDQLVRELWRWRDDYERESRNGILRMRDDAEAMMYEIIEQIDIDRFIFEIWGIFIAESQFEAELELKAARESVVSAIRKIAAQYNDESNEPKNKDFTSAHLYRSVHS